MVVLGWRLWWCWLGVVVLGWRLWWVRWWWLGDVVGEMVDGGAGWLW